MKTKKLIKFQSCCTKGATLTFLEETFATCEAAQTWGARQTSIWATRSLLDTKSALPSAELDEVEENKISEKKHEDRYNRVIKIFEYRLIRIYLYNKLLAN